MGMSTGGGGSGSGGGPSMLAEINVTPMVDVMLVLLIIFMVAAPMLQVGVPVELPKSDAKQVPDTEGKLIITVPLEFQKNKIVYIVKTPYLFGPAFEAALKENQKLQLEREVYVHADQGLPYGVVVKVMGAVSKNGGDRINLVTDPLE
jgi:biopolymer transport protein TolR